MASPLLTSSYNVRVDIAGSSRSSRSWNSKTTAVCVIVDRFDTPLEVLNLLEPHRSMKSRNNEGHRLKRFKRIAWSEQQPVRKT